jgi:hypothetical protein
VSRDIIAAMLYGLAGGGIGGIVWLWVMVRVQRTATPPGVPRRQVWEATTGLALIVLACLITGTIVLKAGR